MAAEMPEEMPLIADQPAFLTALGIDPATVVSNSVHVQFDAGGAAVITWQSVRHVPPHVLGMAFLASAAPTKEDNDPKPAKKAAARTPRKAPRKE